MKESGAEQAQSSLTCWLNGMGIGLLRGSSAVVVVADGVGKSSEDIGGKELLIPDGATAADCADCFTFGILRLRNDAPQLNILPE